MEKNAPLSFSRFVISRKNAWFWGASAYVLFTYFFTFFETNVSFVSYARLFLFPLYFFYLPGALIAETVYGEEESRLEKLAASIGLSFVITILNGLMLDFTSLGITSSLVTTNVMIITETLAVLMLLGKYLRHKFSDFKYKDNFVSLNNESTVQKTVVPRMLKIGVYLSYFSLVLFMITLPIFDYAQPDPYFHVKNLPFTYWVALLVSMTTILASTLRNQPKMGLRVLFPFIALTNSIPRLMYKNEIWYDTYEFVGETFNIIRYGRIGFGSGPETPGISIYAAQLSLASEINYLSTASFLPLLMPVIIGLLIYLIATFFLDDKGAVLASLFYFGFNWLGFYFNRECFSLILQLLTWYFTLKVLIGKTGQRFTLVLAVMSFLALVASHPATSLFIVFNTLGPVILIPLARMIRKKEFIVMGRLVSLLITLTVIFFLIWIFWYSQRTFDLYFGEAIQSIEAFLFSPNPVSRTITVAGIYSDAYYPIILFRFYEVFFSVVIGTVSSLFLLFFMTPRWKTFLLSGWYLSCISFSLYINYSVRFSLLTRSFLYSLPSLSILIVFLLLRSGPAYLINKRFTTAGKIFLISNMILFLTFLPMTMYAQMSFFYPPTATLNYENFLTSRASGSAFIRGGHVEANYFNLINQNITRTLFIHVAVTFFIQNVTYFTTYFNIIGWIFRAYAVDGFMSYKQPLTQIITQFEEVLTSNSSLCFARVYVVGAFHIAYIRQV